jgi:hypothetical protein
MKGHLRLKFRLPISLQLKGQLPIDQSAGWASNEKKVLSIRWVGDKPKRATSHIWPANIL